MAQMSKVEFRFNRTTTTLTDIPVIVTVNSVETAEITATLSASAKSTVTALKNVDKGIVCFDGTDGNSSAATSTEPQIYTLTVTGLSTETLGVDKGLTNIAVYNKALNSGGAFQGSDVARYRHYDVSYGTDETSLTSLGDEIHWISANGIHGSTDRKQDFVVDGEVAANTPFVVQLKLYNVTSEEATAKGDANYAQGCYFGLTGFVLTYGVDNTDAKNALGTAIENANAMVPYIGEGLGKYTYTGEGDYEALFNGIVNFYNGITNLTAIADIETKTAELNNLVAAFEINQPEKGKYYRFKGYNNDNYMLSDECVVDNNDRLAMGSGELASAIFYYGEDGSLLSFANGCYLPKAVKSGTDWTCLAVGTTGPSVTFAEGASLGAYGFYVGDDASRAYYSGRKTYVDAGGSIAANNGYDWIIEEVTTLPVTVTEAGYATFFAPVEVTVPEGTVTAHTVTVDGEWASLSEALTTIPAKTGVVLANSGTVELAINYEGTAAAIEGNVLAGTVATEYVAANAYVLANGEAGIGFYKAALNKVENTKFQNNSHKAYLVVDGADGAAYYSFRFPGTTGVEKVEIGNEKSEIYDLTGRRVEAITAPGIYIVNGVKRVVR